MNFKTSRYRWTASVVLLTVLAVSGCGKKNDEAAVNTPANKTASEAPAASPLNTVTPATAASPGSSGTSKSNKSTTGTTTTATNLGVPPQGKDCPSNAPIKGNKAGKRGNIYHDPTKSPDYKNVKAEVCFKDVATAEKAGYRAPKGK